MAGLLAYAAAGAAAGLGKGLVEDAKAMREAALEEVRHHRTVARDEAQRGFQREERVAGQEFRSGESAEDREHRIRIQDIADERADKRADRTDQRAEDRFKREAEAHSDTFAGGDGFLYERPKGGGPARRIVDESGQPVRAPAAKPGYRQRQRPISDSQAVYEVSYDDGKTWEPLGEPFKRTTRAGSSIDEFIDDQIAKSRSDGTAPMGGNAGTDAPAASDVPPPDPLTDIDDKTRQGLEAAARAVLGEGTVRRDPAGVKEKLRGAGIDPALLDVYLRQRSEK